MIEEGLEDVSVSRVGKTWGVPLPIAEGHVVYVWFDALINYISALGYGGEDDAKFKKYWPADCHVIGKDITRFHCLIWPAMLMAAGLAVPKSVFGHGFVYSKGTKMSKTLGNILDPAVVADFFGDADAVRYLLLREIAFDRDGDFTIEHAVMRYNAELANELGNLFSRTLAMVQRYRGGKVPAWTARSESRLRASDRRCRGRLLRAHGPARVRRGARRAVARGPGGEPLYRRKETVGARKVGGRKSARRRAARRSSRCSG